MRINRKISEIKPEFPGLCTFSVLKTGDFSIKPKDFGTKPGVLETIFGVSWIKSGISGCKQRVFVLKTEAIAIPK